MKISVVGTGYVGLVAGVCFADAGHQVWCVDRDSKKIDTLKSGAIPIYEPGLEDIMAPAVRSGRLHFTTSLQDAVDETEIVFIAVGTPEKEDGSADMGPTFSVIESVAKASKTAKVLVLKSTVPVGTAAQVRSRLREISALEFEVVSNPEFLKEGAAVDDFLRPDRIIIGHQSARAKTLMQELYSPFVKNGHPIYFMDNVSAELTKYAANAFLSVKISFINELALLSDKVGADINQVRLGFTSDRRINPAFFYPGVGFGGSCFPKDTKALIHTGAAHGIPMQVSQAADDVNDRQKHYLYELMTRHFGSLKGKTIAMWGLSFKPRTDDVREAPALYLIEDIVRSGGRVVAFDPIGAENAVAASTVKFDLAENAIAALKGADALAIVTEWNEFRGVDFAVMRSQLKSPIVFDGRNVFDPADMKMQGFEYYCIGRQAVFNRTERNERK